MPTDAIPTPTDPIVELSQSPKIQQDPFFLGNVFAMTTLPRWKLMSFLKTTNGSGPDAEAFAKLSLCTRPKSIEEFRRVGERFGVDPDKLRDLVRIADGFSRELQALVEPPSA